MTLICAWCNTLMGARLPLDDHSITHGLCKSCERDLYKQIEAIEPARNILVKAWYKPRPTPGTLAMVPSVRGLQISGGINKGKTGLRKIVFGKPLRRFRAMRTRKANEIKSKRRKPNEGI